MCRSASEPAETPLARFPKRTVASVIIWACGVFLALLWTSIDSYAAEPLRKLTWKVEGVTREALVHVPETAEVQATPVVFAFHGHGGSMQKAARMFGLHTRWPDAIVVYMQGLNTPGRLTDPDGKLPGWQAKLGDQNDRDLKFFDAVLARLQRDYKVDRRRIYATGHSNGGVFTYLLWAGRAETFAAFAPSAAIAMEKPTTPKPVLHVAGEKDALVKFAWQKRTVSTLRELNECGAGQSWRAENNCMLFRSKRGTPVVSFIHGGAHQFPPRAPALIVKFFKEHTLP